MRQGSETQSKLLSEQTRAGKGNGQEAENGSETPSDTRVSDRTLKGCEKVDDRRSHTDCRTRVYIGSRTGGSNHQPAGAGGAEQGSSMKHCRNKEI